MTYQDPELNRRTGRAKREYREIPLTQGKVAIVDAEDFEWLSQWKWSIKPGKKTVYAARGRRKAEGAGPRTVTMHRLLLNPPESLQVDHIDGNGLNNSRANLRIVTNRQNCLNRAPNPNNSSGYKGVQKNRDRWHATVKINGKHIHLGRFKDKLEAAKAYDAAAREIYGEFARTNF